MKKVLMITNSPIFPVINGSRQRVYNLLHLLEKAGCKVDIVIYNDRNGYFDTSMALKDNNVYFFDADRTKSSLVKAKDKIREKLPIKALKIYSFPYGIDEAFPRGLDDYVAHLHEKNKYDIAMVEYVYLSKALTKLGNDVFKIIDTHDVLAYRCNMYYSMNTKPRNFYTNFWGERQGVMRADAILAIQKNEKRYFEKLTGNKKKVYCIGNYFKPVKENFVEKKTILFLGSNNDPNRQALMYFLKDIWHSVKERVPDAEFIIAGDVSNAVEDSEAYTKAGFVEKLEDIYQQARVVINPMLSGTGLPIKTIEALAYSKAVLMTQSGARGLNKNFNEEAFLIAGNTDDFANKLVELLKNDDLIKKLQSGSRKYMRKYNSMIYHNIKQILNECEMDVR